MIRIYERSLCQSYASAYRQGILLAKTDDEAEALSIVESLTETATSASRCWKTGPCSICGAVPRVCGDGR